MASAPRGDANELARFRRLLTATILATFALIIIGGVVRVSDSGLGCGPEGSGTHGWPLCGGRVLPLLHEQLIIGLAIVAFRRLRSHRWLVRGVVAAAVLVNAQAGLGRLTVAHGIAPAFV